MKIEKAKWFNNADSPVVLMVDDFTNGWVDLNKNGKIDLGEDWGAAMDLDNSSFGFLKKNLIELFPEIRITFFVPVNHSVCPTFNGAKSYYYPINSNPKFMEFARRIHEAENFEASYHGYNHVTCRDGRTLEQEWKLFKNIDTALKTIEKGKKIFKEVFGEDPRGGKYCGYQVNGFSDESINTSGFNWWCRKWNRGIKNVEDDVNFNPVYFGSNNLVDIPSTINGDLFIHYEHSRIKLRIKKIIGRKYSDKASALNFGYNKLNSLLEGRQVVSIQEHISSIRADGKKQFTNIIDDIESLQIMYEYFRKKNVWHATCSEIAEYFDTHQQTTIRAEDDKIFVSNKSEDFSKKFLSLIISSESTPNRLITPNEEILLNSIHQIDKNKYIIQNFPIINGVFKFSSKKNVVEYEIK